MSNAGAKNVLKDISHQEAAELLKMSEIGDDDVEQVISKCLGSRRTTMFGLMKQKKDGGDQQKNTGDSAPYVYARNGCPNLISVLTKFVTDRAKKLSSKPQCLSLSECIAVSARILDCSQSAVRHWYFNRIVVESNPPRGHKTMVVRSPAALFECFLWSGGKNTNPEGRTVRCCVAVPGHVWVTALNFLVGCVIWSDGASIGGTMVEQTTYHKAGHEAKCYSWELYGVSFREARLIDPRAASCLRSSLSGDAVASRVGWNILLSAYAFNCENLAKLRSALQPSVQDVMVRALVDKIIRDSSCHVPGPALPLMSVVVEVMAFHP